MIDGGKLHFKDGSITHPPGPGLGVKLGQCRLVQLHDNDLTCVIRARDDASEMRKHVLGWVKTEKRF